MTLTSAEMMFLEVGTRLAPLVWGGTACAIVAAVAFLAATVREMGSRRTSPTLALSPRPAGAPDLDESLDEAA